MINYPDLLYKILFSYGNSGGKLDFTNITTDATLTEQEEQLAVRLDLELFNMIVQGRYLSDIINMGGKIFIFYSLDGGVTWSIDPMFVGQTIIRDYESAINKTLQITIYDYTWRLQRSKERVMIKKGDSSREIICKLLAEQGVDYSYKGPDFKLETTPYRNNTVAEIILEILRKAFFRGKGKYILRNVYDGGINTIEIIRIAQNTTVYKIRSDNVFKVRDKASIEELVTVVRVMTTSSADDGYPIQKGGGETDDAGIPNPGKTNMSENPEELPDVSGIETGDGTEPDMSENPQRDENGNLISEVPEGYTYVGGGSTDEIATTEAVLNKNLEFGRIQEIVYRDSNGSLADAMQEAREILQEKGSPKQTATFETLDIPSLRKGDKIDIYAGNLTGGASYWVKNIKRNLKTKTMEAEIEPL